MRHYRRGEIEVIDDDPRNYTFSNVFEVASRSSPYEKVVVAKNLEYVIEVLRAEGRSDWFAAPHDEFVLGMDGRTEIELVKLDRPDAVVAPGAQGTVQLEQMPAGERMGSIRIGRGHQALLPCGAAYRFSALEGPGVLIMQTTLGRLSVEKWAQICLT